MDDFNFFEDFSSHPTDDDRRMLADVMEPAKICGAAMDAQDAIIITDLQGAITWINPSFQALTGFSLKDCLGKRPGDLLQGPETDKATVEMIRSAIANRRGITCEILNYSRDGFPYWVQISIVPIRDKAGDLLAYASTSRDITFQRMQAEELAQAHDLVRRASLVDSLTGLPNRRAFDQVVAERHARARTGDGDAGDLCLIRIDLDFFKRVNDSLGHAAGDLALTEVARILEREVGTDERGDFAARIGGDEFVVLAAPGTGHGRARTICRTLRGEICKDMDFEGTTFRIGSSYGYVVFPAETTTTDEMMSLADVALYEAKRRGRGRIVPYDDELASRRRLDEEAAERAHAAVRDWTLAPVFRLRRDAWGGTVSAIEVAPGMVDGERVSRLPEEVVAAGRKAGNAQEMTGIALWQALQPLAARAEARGRAWPLRLLTLCPLTEAGPFLDTLDGALDLYPSMSIGITPGFLSDLGREAARERVDALRRKGLRLELHGFGVSEMVLSDVAGARPEAVQLGSERTEGLAADPAMREQLETLIAMARAMGAGVVASGISDPEDACALAGLGCDEITGEAVSAWMSLDALLGALDADHGSAAEKTG